MKSKLKELAALCIDKEVVFHCNGEVGTGFLYSAYAVVDGEIKYFGNPSEVAAGWKADSVERLNEIIALVEQYNG